MSSRRILYLDSHRLTAYRWQAGRVVMDGIFEATPEDLARFAQYLETRAKGLYYLLANVSEESYQQEVIPYLHGNDRSALINRKISQYFFSTPLAHAQSLGFEKDRRKNERLLLTGLTNPAHFEPWLAVLDTAEAALAGIYTPAQLGGTLLQQLGHANERCLLLTVQDNSIRESFVVNGITVFSRMAPLYDSSYAGIASALAAEAGKLHQYLLGQRLIGRTEHHNAYIVTHPLAANAIKNSCIDFGGLSFVQIDSHQAAQKLGLKTPPQDSRVESIFIHLLGTKLPSQQYAPEGARHHYRLAQIRNGLMAFAGLALLVTLSISMAQLLGMLTASQEASALNLRDQEMQQRYQTLTSTFPQVQASNEELRKVTARYTELQRQQGGPVGFYRALSTVLNDAPAIELTSIEWKQSSESKEALPDGKTASASLSGEVRFGKNTPPRTTIAAFENFVQALGKLPGMTVSVVQSPYDIESSRALKGSDRDEDTLKQQAFSLRLQYKAQP